MVSTHAHTTLLATPHLTADSRWVVPTPTMAPVIVWVVDTGMPACAVKNNVEAAASSALIPPDGRDLGDLRPHGVNDPPPSEEGA